jgi:hypothetical protein
MRVLNEIADLVCCRQMTPFESERSNDGKAEELPNKENDERH